VVAREQNLGGDIIKLIYEHKELNLNNIRLEPELLRGRGEEGWRLASSILLPTGFIHYVFFREVIVPTISEAKLTPRQNEILELLTDFRSSQEIAKELGISVKTVETHIGNIMSKLLVSSRSDLMRRLRQRNRI